MPEAKIIEEREISLAEVKEKLGKVKKERELGVRATKTEEYLKNFKIKKLKDVEKIAKELESADIPRLKPRQIHKLINLEVADEESAKTVLSGEGLALKTEHYKKMAEILSKSL